MKFAIFSLLAVVLAIPSAQAAPASLAPFFGNTIVAQDQDTKAVAHLWLDPGGKYTLVYDLGVQKIIPVVNGVFRIEGRDGRYSVKSDGTVCFKPNTPPGKVYGMDTQQEIFAGHDCVALGSHAAGDQWTSRDAKGRTVKLWLLQGR